MSSVATKEVCIQWTATGIYVKLYAAQRRELDTDATNLVERSLHAASIFAIFNAILELLANPVI